MRGGAFARYYFRVRASANLERHFQPSSSYRVCSSLDGTTNVITSPRSTTQHNNTACCCIAYSTTAACSIVHPNALPPGSTSSHTVKFPQLHTTELYLLLSFACFFQALTERKERESMSDPNDSTSKPHGAPFSPNFIEFCAKVRKDDLLFCRKLASLS
jgi:hypothetical protein